MNPERKIIKEAIDPRIPVVAIEGVGGSGKSHIGDLVTQRLNEEDIQILNRKVSGLGESDRVRQLKIINEKREELINGGGASEKVVDDKKRDKIFRLATKHQTKLFLEELHSTDADLAIIDRTPLMSWVYAASVDPENPYLDEILEDGLEVTSKLMLSRVYFLEVSPITAYSRLIARTCINDRHPEKKAREICSLIGAPKGSENKIVELAMNLIKESPSLRPKSFRPWDFIPFEVMTKECQNYKKIFGELERESNIQFIIIDAERTLNEVVSDVESNLRSFISREPQRY